MLGKVGALMLAAGLLVVCGCASTLESANEGAKTVGETGGQVMRIPHSASEGVTDGIVGKPESNPYSR